MKIGKYRVHLKSYIGLCIPTLFMLVLVYYLVGAINIINTDAMLLTRALAVLMTVCMFFVVKSELIIQKEGDDDAVKRKPFFSDRNSWKTFIGFCALSAVYIISLNFLGFIIATLIFPAATMAFLGVRSVKTLVITPIILTASIYLLFKVILMISLPVGIFGI